MRAGSRLGFLALWRAHWFGLSQRHSDGSITPDRLTRAITIGTPIVGLVSILGLRWRLDPSVASAMIAGAALIAAGLITAFSQVATWRERLTDRAADHRLEQPARDMLDEAAAHVLEAIVESVYLATLAVLVLALPTSSSAWHWVAVVLSGAAVALGLRLILLFVILATQLYAAYVLRNRVRKELDGFVKLVRPQAPESNTSSTYI